MKPFPLFQPPTVLLDDEILAQAVRLEASVRGKLDHMFPESAPHKVYFGKELEFFVNGAAFYAGDRTNPNFHLAQTLFDRLLEMHAAEPFLYRADPLTRGRTFAELRTEPLPATQAIASIEMIGRRLADEAVRLGLYDERGEYINPHSLHVHLSVRGRNEENLLYQPTRDDDRSALCRHIMQGLNHFLTAAMPLCLLPSEIASLDHYRPSIEKGSGVPEHQENHPYRCECRMLASEWAAHPRLSMLLILGALNKAMDDYIAQDGRFVPDSPAVMTKDHYFFQYLHHQMAQSEMLQQHLTPELVRKLVTVTYHYPRIERGELTLPQAVEQAREALQALSCYHEGHRTELHYALLQTMSA